jgi:HSP20 family protein
MFKLTNINSPVKREGGLVDSFFDELFDIPVIKTKNWSFKLDVKEDDKNYFVEADLPGVKKDEININYEDQTLSIAIEREEQKEEENENYIHRERGYCSMKRALHLPNIDPKKIKAKLDEGVLKLTAEKTEPEKKGHIIQID